MTANQWKKGDILVCPECGALIDEEQLYYEMTETGSLGFCYCRYEEHKEMTEYVTLKEYIKDKELWVIENDN